MENKDNINKSNEQTDKYLQELYIDIDKLAQDFPSSSENEEKSLPVDQEVAEKAFKWEWTNVLNEKKESNKRKGKSQSSSLLILTVLMSLSFIIAFAFMTSAILSVNTDSNKSDQGSELPTNSSYYEDSKTIYVHEYDSNSGLLTPQEIYSACLPSVVSIFARTDSSEGIGSGFVYSSDGYIATAHHVIDKMNHITVLLPSGKEYAAEVVASDEMTDIAMLKIDASGLSPVKFGSSKDLLVGEEVIAIGTPASLEFSGTMTRGDISYNNRTVYVTNEKDGTLQKKMTLIQTSAALNPGNSGGPLFDAYGNMVGIVTMKLGQGFDGIGFAIPCDSARPILEDMKNGIEITDQKRNAIAQKAAKLGVAGENYVKNDIYGVRIAELSESSDASKKLKKDDVIVSINDTVIPDTRTLLREISKYSVGQKVRVTVYRAKQLLSFEIILVS